MTRSTGTSTWLDLDTHDLAAASAFYAGLFGWTFEDTGEQFGHYQIIRKDGALVGGAMDVSGMTCPDGDPLPPSWDVYLAVDDLDARLAAATEHGATVIVQPMDIGESGRMAAVLDATGANIAFWEAKDLDGYEFTGKPGSPVWFELMTHRFDEASAFYTAVVDANLVAMGDPTDDSMRYATNGPGDSASWGLCDASGIMPAEATGWRIYFGVESSDAAVERIRELGGSLLDGPVDSPFGRIATVADPEGATFQICAMSEAVAEG
ncbi:VOC family protein [Brachybacterium huguangmaarense]|uniref:VOC family protein n=1 Tax=Brachybacterium huguangmaarense TaxID=1652028 RepID=A0ABY6G112_9MICO|nr:VOC family protein [Brachybacterium huguangmaarense]UYG16882.1 VOC family protein [Brachybacterium huguangmaarense]